MSIPSWNKNRCLDLNFRYFAKLRSFLTIIPYIRGQISRKFREFRRARQIGNNPRTNVFSSRCGKAISCERRYEDISWNY